MPRLETMWRIRHSRKYFNLPLGSRSLIAAAKNAHNAHQALLSEKKRKSKANEFNADDRERLQKADRERQEALAALEKRTKVKLCMFEF